MTLGEDSLVQFWCSCGRDVEKINFIRVNFFLNLHNMPYEATVTSDLFLRSIFFVVLKWLFSYFSDEI